MSLQQLRQLLTNEGITVGNVRQLTTASDAWFMADPTPASLALRCIFRELDGEWDEQGVPAEDYEPVERLLRPAAQETVEAILLGDATRLSSALSAFAIAFRDCCR